MGNQTQGRSSSGSKGRLLYSANDNDVRAGWSRCVLGTLPHIAYLFTVYGGTLLGILITTTFLQIIPLEVNTFYIVTPCIAAGLLITSQFGMKAPTSGRGLLICFFLLTLLLVCAEVTLVTLWIMQMLEKQPDSELSMSKTPKMLRYAFHLISPLLNTRTADKLKRYEDEDIYESTYMTVLAGLVVLLVILQILAIILALIAICYRKKREYDGQSTLQRSNSVYYERGPAWNPELYANANWMD